VECRKGECLVSAFDRERAILGDRALPIEEREQALKYIIHLAGDAAQPLHDWGPDRGGNAYQVRFDDRGTNIHHVWDTELIRTYAIEDAGHWGRRPNYRGLTAELVRDSFQLKIPNDQNPVDWVEAGCREAQKPGIYPPRVVPASYADKWRPVVELQLIEGGEHLADVLNNVLGNPR